MELPMLVTGTGPPGLTAATPSVERGNELRGSVRSGRAERSGMRRGRPIVVGAGQSGPAAAHKRRERGWEPVILEAGPEPVGSWPDYYDSLRLFSPRRFSEFPGYRFPGDPDGYPI